LKWFHAVICRCRGAVYRFCSPNNAADAGKTFLQNWELPFESSRLPLAKRMAGWLMIDFDLYSRMQYVLEFSNEGSG
jgi:hypothetical protein